MAAPALFGLLCLLEVLPVAGGGVGEKPVAVCRSPRAERSAGSAAPLWAYQRPRRFVLLPDTTRKPVAVPDTVKARRPAPAAALEPDDDKLTRKSTIYIVTAMAVLTLTTLLLYNVRSR